MSVTSATKIFSALVKVALALLLLGGSGLLCCGGPLPVLAAPVLAAPVLTAPVLANLAQAGPALEIPAPLSATDNMLLSQHPAWQRLDTLYSQMPLAWARRYQELKTIADELDTYSRKLPPQLAHLREVTAATQSGVVNIMLDLVPMQIRVVESYYLTRLLQQWRWKLDGPLQGVASTLTTLNYFSTVLESIREALERQQLQPHKRPVVEMTVPDFILLYDMVHTRNSRLYDSVNALHTRALDLFTQIERGMTTAEASFPAQWIAYYTSPLTITYGAFSHLGADISAMWNFLPYDYSPVSWVPLLVNMLLLCGLCVLHVYIRRIMDTQNQGFVHALGTIFYSLDKPWQWSLLVAIVVTANSLMHYLPQFHTYIPYPYAWQMLVAFCLALWARTESGAPQIWQQVLPILVGQMLIHGDASSILVLLGMGGAQVVVLLSLLRKPSPQACRLRSVWMGALVLGLLLTILGMGRLTVLLYMLLLLITGSLAMLRRWASPSGLNPYLLERKIFLLFLTLALGVMGISFLMACSGLDFLLGYWQENPLLIGGIPIYAGDALLLLLLLLTTFFFSQVAKQSLLNLARRRRVLDSSAVPVLYAMINAALWIFFAIFLLGFLGVNVTSLAFIGGGLTVGVGIASKTILSNFFCGLVIIFARVVRAGDLVELNGVQGRVLNVNMRSTMLETLCSGILLVPNEDMLTSRLTNWTLNNLNAREDVTIRVVPESNVDIVLATLEEAASNMPGTLSTPPPKALFSGFDDNAINCILQVWVSDVHDRRAILSALRQNIYHIFDQRGILLASPRLAVSVQPQHGEKARVFEG